MFRKINKSRGDPGQTIKDWQPNIFKNNILCTLWQAFPGSVMCVVWKERNGRIFHDKFHSSEDVWKTLTSNLLETIHSMQWSEDDKVFSGPEKRIEEEWGLNKEILDGLHERIKTYRI